MDRNGESKSDEDYPADIFGCSAQAPVTPSAVGHLFALA